MLLCRKETYSGAYRRVPLPSIQLLFLLLSEQPNNIRQKHLRLYGKSRRLVNVFGSQIRFQRSRTKQYIPKINASGPT